MDIGSTLSELSGIDAPSGHEDAMIARMVASFRAAGLTARVDPLGNVIAQVRPRRAGYPHVLVFAHMDEVGFIVRKIDPDGFLRLQRIGGIPEKCMAGQCIEFLGAQGSVSGVIGTKAHHLTTEPEKWHVVPVQDVFADIGMRSRGDVLAAGITVGTPATWYPIFQQHGDIIRAKAIDNRAGCTVLLALAEAASEIEGGAAWTLAAGVQEEFNIRGIAPAVRAVEPDMLVCLDIVPSTDTPDTVHIGDVAVGAGASLGCYSFHGRGTLNGLIPNPKLVQFIEECARRRSLPLQRHIFFGGLTDASYAQLEGGGIPGVDVGIPTRYTHSPVETCSVRDIQTAAALVRALLEEASGDLDLSRG
jgi:putative aminopeptidase FrvX